MVNKRYIDNLLEDTVETEPETVNNEKVELLYEIDCKADKYKAAAERYADADDMEALRALHKSLVGNKKTSKLSTAANMNDTFKYAVWAAGAFFGLIIGMIVGVITATLISDVDFLSGVVGWIQFLIVIVFGGIGLFIASTITDKQRR